MRKLGTLLQEFASECRGVVTAEFLVVLPMLFGAFVTAFEMGRALWAFNVMTSDVEAGLRYLTRTPATASDITAATNLVETGSSTGTLNKPPWNWTTSPTLNVSTTTVSAGYNQSMTVVTMSAAVPITLPFLNSYWIKATTAYTLRVSDQASCITGPSTPCTTN
jgi:Flp pilus assembly protein TadG